MRDPVIIATLFGLTLLLSLGLPLGVKPLLMKLGIVDVPNERSSHERPVLRGLGLSVLLAMTAGFILAIIIIGIFEPAWFAESLSGRNTLILVASTVIASGLLGFGEDLKGISVHTRSVLLLLISFVAAFVLVNPSLFTGGQASFGWGPAAERAELPIWIIGLLLVYAVLFISSFINVANFMDGLNGISGFHGVIAGVTFAAVGYSTDLLWLGCVGVIIAAGYLGFLPYNLMGPGAFLGDVGSYLLGGAVAITSFAALMAGVPILATIGPMVIYFGDVGVTLFKRIRNGHKWDEPHKEHTYQQIQQRGYTHVQASLITAGCTAVTSLLGYVALFVGGGGSFALLIAGFAVLVVYLQLPKLLPQRHHSDR